jgi:hypothetical protein
MVLESLPSMTQKHTWLPVRRAMHRPARDRWRVYPGAEQCLARDVRRRTRVKADVMRLMFVQESSDRLKANDGLSANSSFH